MAASALELEREMMEDKAQRCTAGNLYPRNMGLWGARGSGRVLRATRTNMSIVFLNLARRVWRRHASSAIRALMCMNKQYVRDRRFMLDPVHWSIRLRVAV